MKNLLAFNLIFMLIPFTKVFYEKMNMFYFFLDVKVLLRFFIYNMETQIKVLTENHFHQ